MDFWGRSRDRSLLQILLLALALSFTANAAWAQDAEEEDEDVQSAETDEAADLDKVVVTGSRLQRETYTSISPLQIITAQGSREAGLIDSAEILQQSTASAGQQIDLSFSGFVLDNGPAHPPWTCVVSAPAVPWYCLTVAAWRPPASKARPRLRTST